MDTNVKNVDVSILALQALAWALQDEKRAERLLSLTGLTPDILRDAVSDRSTQAAILGFLENHEPDLIACSVSIDVSPERLVSARHELEGVMPE